MNKYAHIESMEALDHEIERLDLKKKIIIEEVKGSFEDIKEELSFPSIAMNYIGIEVSENVKSKIYTLTRAAVIIFTAFKGGRKIFRTLTSLFK